jgi:hypothetical protein
MPIARGTQTEAEASHADIEKHRWVILPRTRPRTGRAGCPELRQPARRCIVARAVGLRLGWKADRHHRGLERNGVV